MVELGQDTRSKILSAAIAIFREKGREGAKMQEIADRAAINKAMLHYYFRNKDLLFEEVFRLTAVDFFSSINGILNEDEGLRSKINRICEAYISMSMHNPFLPVFMISEINKNPDVFLKKMFAADQPRPDYTKFRKQIEEEIVNGNINPIHPMQLISNILSLCVFPIVSRPMMQFMGEIDDHEFIQMMEERKKIIPQLIWTSIEKKL